jgi:hypothetical protein
MIRSILIRQNQIIKENLTVAEITDSFQNPDDLVWVNLQDSDLTEINMVMNDIFIPWRLKIV